jgi:hypothetical protein
MSNNKNSRIVTEYSPTSIGARTSYTARRDPGSLEASITTDSHNHSNLFITRPGLGVVLTGTEARTLYTLLRNHYGENL